MNATNREKDNIEKQKIPLIRSCSCTVACIYTENVQSITLQIIVTCKVISGKCIYIHSIGGNALRNIFTFYSNGVT